MKNPREFLSQYENEVKMVAVKSEKAETLKKERAIVHYISTEVLDRGREIVKAKGIDTSQFKEIPSVWYSHSWKFDPKALPIAKSLWQKTDDVGMFAKTQFGKTQFADEVYVLHEDGIINSWSVGIAPARDSEGKILKGSLVFDEGANITTWEKCLLLEYSSAPIPMNPKAVDIVKSYGFNSVEIKSFIEKAEGVVTVEERLKSIEDKLENIIKMQSELDAMVKGGEERMEDVEKNILSLTEEIANKTSEVEETITMEMPVVNIDVKSIIDGGISRLKSKLN